MKTSTHLLSYAALVASILTSPALAKSITCSGDSYAKIYAAYQKVKAWGIETQIELSDCDPEMVRSADALRDYAAQLCDALEAKRYGTAQVAHFSDDRAQAGYSMMQLIERGLISAHVANKTNTVYVTILCNKVYNPYDLAAFSQAFFNASNAQSNVVLR
jgi:hypothetical protein